MSGCGVVIAAAGTSRRMGQLDKTTWPLLGRPVIAWVLEAFDAVDTIDEIVIAVSAGNEAAVRELVASFDSSRRITICRGGETRKDSVEAAVAHFSPGIELVLIHDAARPLVTPALIEAGIAAGRASGAAIPTVPVADTIKRVDASGAVVDTLIRDELAAAQTPQVFRRDWLAAAYALDKPVATDEATLVELAGFTVQTFPGSPENLKLTTASDLLLAEALLRQRCASGSGR